MLKKSACLLLLPLLWLCAPAHGTDQFCTGRENRENETRLLRKQKLAADLARNASDLVHELESLESSSKRLARGSTILFGISSSTLFAAGSVKVAILAGARAGSSSIAATIAKGARKYYYWTGGSTTKGVLWDYTTTSAYAMLVRDKFAARHLRPIIKEMNSIGFRGFEAENETAIGFLASKELQRISELEKKATPDLHEGRWYTLGWDDVHQVQIMLVAARAKERVYQQERAALERLLTRLWARCGTKESVKLAEKATNALKQLEASGTSLALVSVTSSRDKRLEWRSAPASSHAAPSHGTRAKAAR